MEKYEIISFSKNNKSIIAMVILLILGMVLGSLSVHEINLDILHKIDFLFLNNFKEIIDKPGLDVFISSLSNLFFIILLLEFSALSFWGSGLIPLIIFFRGFSIGLTTGYLYLIYGLKGIAFYILIMLPGMFIALLSIILFSAEAFKFSVKFAKTLFPHANNQNLFSCFLFHLKNSKFSLALLPISAIVDTCFVAMFSRFFEF
ncbi:MAG: hypothetical protein IJJ04_03555 [Clostridia bacterium]|nr:hypothetical protein [Clostridia bacterium]